MIGRSLALVSFLVSGPVGPAGDVAVEALADGPPAVIAEAVRSALAPSGLRVRIGGKPALDFWFRSALARREAKPEKGVRYPTLNPGDLVGVLRVHDPAVDFRAQKVAPGVYTLRYAVQPDDGDHQEMTEARDFLLLSAATDDQSPETMEPKSLVRQSAKLNGKKHPGVLFLAAVGEGPAPAMRTQGSPAQVVLESAVSASAGPPIRLAIVVAGTYKE